jgi:hypothetical protein
MRKGTIALLAVVAALSLSMSSQASAMTFGGEVYGAFNTVSMEDWNDAIDESNSSSGSDFDNVSNGFTGGLDLRAWMTPSWLVTVGWEPLFLSSEDGNDSSNKLSLDANAYTATAAYFFPSAGKAKYGIGAGIGFYQSNGELESSGSPTIDIDGNGIGFHFLGMGEWTVSPGFSFTAAAGYRVANLSDTELTDGTTTVDSPYDNDYSGFMSRVGLSFYMPKSGGE